MQYHRLKIFLVFLLTVTIVLSVKGTPAKKPLPSQGVVPDEATAVRIAEAVFLPIFGDEEVAKFRPYHAQLKDGIWTVYGTLQRGALGGTPQLTIQKRDGKVTEVWHSL